MQFFKRHNRIAERPSSEHIRKIEASGLFDRDWYLKTYPDVAQAGIDPVEHYLKAGAEEGRNPGPAFDTIYYLSENPLLQAEKVNPLLYYIDHGGNEMCRPKPLTEAQRFESFHRSTKSGALQGGALLTQMYQVDYRRTELPGEMALQGLPLPPLDLAVRIGSATLAGFEVAGRGAKTTLMRCLPRDFSFVGARCLDFGCGIGRVIRHFRAEAEVSEFWGCDIDGTSIRWNTENLSPPFAFFQLGGAPVLPFESSSFDFVYALGVFNQLYEDWQMFAMEIRRILKPGGIFFLSFNGQTPYEEMFERSYEDLVKTTGLFIRNPFNGWGNGGPTLIHSAAWIQKHWGSIFDIDYFAMESLMDYGSICMLRKPPFGRPRGAIAPVLNLATSQPFHPNARGKLIGNPDPSQSFTESYGIEGRGAVEVHGWIAFRDDEAQGAKLEVDGQSVPSVTVFSPGAPYRDWNAPAVPFVVRTDLGAFATGRYRLTVNFTARAGATHALTIPLHIIDA